MTIFAIIKILFSKNRLSSQPKDNSCSHNFATILGDFRKYCSLYYVNVCSIYTKALPLSIEFTRCPVFCRNSPLTCFAHNAMHLHCNSILLCCTLIVAFDRCILTICYCWLSEHASTSTLSPLNAATIFRVSIERYYLLQVPNRWWIEKRKSQYNINIV